MDQKRPFTDSDLAQLFQVYPNIVKSTAAAVDQYGPPGTHLASDVVSFPGDAAELMFKSIGVPRAARQTVAASNPLLQTGPQLRAQQANSPYAGMGPAFLQVLNNDFLARALKGR